MLQRKAGLIAVGCLASAMLLVAAPAARAASDVKTERANGKLVSADVTTKTIVVSEKGKEQAYAVTPEGTVLTRTTVTLNGKASPFSALEPGMIVIVYWKPDGADATKRYARKIDVPKIPREFREDVEAAGAESSSSD